MSFNSKIELLGRLYGPLFNAVGNPDKWKNKLTSIMKELKESNNLRNDIVHAKWFDYNVKTKHVKTKTRIRNHQLEEFSKRIQPRDIGKAVTFIIRLDKKLMIHSFQATVLGGNTP